MRSPEDGITGRIPYIDPLIQAFPKATESPFSLYLTPVNPGFLLSLLVALQVQVCEDPAAAIQRLEAVTTARLTAEFPAAAQQYDTCLARLVEPAHRRLLEREIAKLRPIIGEGIHRQWTQWIDRDPGRVVSEIRGFWIQQDPTPITSSNERFFEHWMRLGEARSRYPGGESGGARTAVSAAEAGAAAEVGAAQGAAATPVDDRFALFLRYGDPDQVKQVTFTLDAAMLPGWFPDRFWKRPGDPSRENRDPSRPLTPADVVAVGDPVADQILDGSASRASGSVRTGVLDSSPLAGAPAPTPFDLLLRTTPSLRMEVWTYSSLGEASVGGNVGGTHSDTPVGTRSDITGSDAMDAFTVPVSFFFQRDPFDGSVRQLSSLDELIPEHLFSGSVEQTGGDGSAALLLQVLIHSQAADLSPFLESSLRRIRQMLTESGMVDPARDAQRIRTEMRSAFAGWYSRLPQEASALDDISASLPLDVVQYRYLDEEGQPRMMVSIESPGNPESGIVDPVYRHALQLFDVDWTPVFTSVRNIRIQTQPDIRSVTVFDVPQSRAINQVASGLFWSSQRDEGTPILDYFGEGYEGVDGILLGSRSSIVPEPLSTDPGTLEMADLILGSDPPLDEPLPGPITFTISNSRKIRQDQVLFLHLQIYHLGLAASGYSDVDFTYRILPVGPQGVDPDQSRFALTLEFESAEPRFTETLEIRTASLDPGVYELQAEVQDRLTGQQIRRSIRFEVVPAP